VAASTSDADADLALIHAEIEKEANDLKLYYSKSAAQFLMSSKQLTKGSFVFFKKHLCV
jgi:hypothetical protein